MLWCLKAKHEGFQSHFRTNCTVDSYWEQNKHLYNAWNMPPTGGTRNSHHADRNNISLRSSLV